MIRFALAGVVAVFAQLSAVQAQSAGPANVWITGNNVYPAWNQPGPNQVGVKLVTGQNCVTVTHLGAMCFTNTGTLTVNLYSADGLLTCLASATINLAGTTNLQIAYAPCLPYVLNTNTTYYLEGTYGAGQQYAQCQPGFGITTTAVAAPQGFAYAGNNVFGGAGDAYGPVSFGYTVGGTYQAPLCATNYYVDNNGTDSGYGTAAAPWQHLAYALTNAPPGSAIFLTSGQTFAEDGLAFKFPNVALTSSGATPAVIRNVSGSNVLQIVNLSGITISNVNVYGYGAAYPGYTNANACIYVTRTVSALNYCTNIAVVGCELTNAAFGVEFYDAFANSQYTFDNLNVSGNRIHDIGLYGVFEWSYFQEAGSFFLARNATTAFNTVSNVWGVAWPFAGAGSGLVLEAVNGWECYSNTIHHLGYNQGFTNGCAGIFPFSNATRVHIWNNTVFDVQADQRNGDGDAIDLDIGTSDSTVEGNFVHDISGVGLYGCEMYSGNIFRWNLVVNCGTNAAQHAGATFDGNGTCIQPGTNWFYNNTVVGGKGGLEIWPRASANNIIANNIFQGGSDCTLLISVGNPDGSFESNSVTLLDNDYSGNFTISYGSSSSATVYTNFGAWRAAGLEVVPGSTNNPLFAVGAGNVAANYELQPASPLIGAGTDIRPYAVTEGGMDYFDKAPLVAGDNLGGLVGSSGGGTYFYLTVNNGTGSGNYTNGQLAGISAVATFGATFTNWSGPNIANPNAAATTMTVYSNTVVTANFITNVPFCSLVVSNGSGSGTYAVGQAINISATAPIGTTFTNWSGPNIANPQLAATTVTVYSNTIVVANFSCTLSVTNGTGSGVYPCGDVVPITANPVSGSYFTNWSGPNIANPAAAATTVTVYTNTVVTAVFAPLPAPPTNAPVTLNVTDYGATGDAATLFVNTVSNSTVVTTTTSVFSGADIGKVVEIFGAGPLGTSTNHQDLVAVIAGVSGGNTISLDRVCGATATNCYSVYGHNNAVTIQNCINAAPSNSVINIPNGTYLVIGSQVLDTNFVAGEMYYTYPSISISKGGLTLVGQSRTNTVLLGCGAWQNKNSPQGVYAYRGFMIACLGPVTNNGPLVIDNLTLDGGVQQGYSGTFAWPASTGNGDGWDVTHDAICDEGTPPLHINKTLSNLTIRNWRGEQLKSSVGGWDGFITITNCSITDGDGSGVNFSFSHNIVNCYFANLCETMEFWQGYASNSCYFQGNFVTNVGAFLAINGAQTNSPNPAYFIQGNTFYGGTGNGIQTCPVQNLTVRSNLFINGVPLVLGVAGYQGSGVNSNIVVSGNVFTNPYAAIVLEGTGANSVYNLTVTNNTVYGGQWFACGYGWGTNLMFANNTTYNMTVGVDCSAFSGQWLLDNKNQFPVQTVYDSSAVSNVVSYAHGSHALTYPYFNTNSIFVLDDTHPLQVPRGAVMAVTNSGTHPGTLYLSQSMSGKAISMANGYSGTFYWNGSAWTTNSVSLLFAPSNLRYSAQN
jgi:hypothetical protein